MDVVWQELTFGTADAAQLIRVCMRLFFAALLGGLIGIEREWAGKDAGLRTHTLVTLGSCIFVVAGVGFAMTTEGVSRVIQGIVTGIGFIGAGTILKVRSEKDIRGLTTSAGIWSASAIGVAVGLGQLGLGILATIVTLIVLTVVRRVEKPIKEEADEDG